VVVFAVVVTLKLEVVWIKKTGGDGCAGVY